MAQHYVYQFYAELEDFKPTIWRRFEIVGSKTMAELGYTLMVMFEMTACHLFCITDDRQKALKERMLKTCTEKELEDYLKINNLNDIVKNRHFEVDLGEERWIAPNEKLYDADKITLKQTSTYEGWRLNFNYDYGDDWNVNLVLEKCEKKEVSLANLPRIIEGAGFGIVEDVGGAYGLENFVKVMQEGIGSEFDHLSQWYGITDFDINHFDKDDLNFRMKKLVRVYKESYEYNYEPTQRSIDIIERKYLK